MVGFYGTSLARPFGGTSGDLRQGWRPSWLALFARAVDWCKSALRRNETDCWRPFRNRSWHDWSRPWSSDWTGSAVVRPQRRRRNRFVCLSSFCSTGCTAGGPMHEHGHKTPNNRVLALTKTDCRLSRSRYSTTTVAHENQAQTRLLVA